MKKMFVDRDVCLSCHTCELVCVVAHSPSKTLYGAIAEESPPLARIHVEPVGTKGFPFQCRHCEDPQCVKACVSKALYIDADSGAVLHDESRCIGCTMCVLACPFGAVEERDMPENRCAVSKCDLCISVSEEPACATACPTGALSFRESSAYSRDKRRAYLVELVSVED